MIHPSETYTVRLEFTGSLNGPQWVARYRGEWIGSAEGRLEAWRLAFGRELDWLSAVLDYASGPYSLWEKKSGSTAWAALGDFEDEAAAKSKALWLELRGGEVAVFRHKGRQVVHATVLDNFERLLPSSDSEYVAAQFDRMTPADSYKVQLRSGADGHTKWMDITAAQAAKIQQLLMEGP
ncbi:hypothetical protein ADL22_12620 [Streptomyces sp. NRRL F-4489]|uniref:hypothetical protein n=1 Tax=Streptomyces sp. NRRL F-4489 TaxID=1609095 RepID=UPI0007481908|nr:hypothetical protein [Streptomyces sp. NRRL F-4489]KUL44780.1 hypothetical protein ADL22_12620 [Streptomyces sp. NRRL F-4489]